jgi:hypothetical protein
MDVNALNFCRFSLLPLPRAGEGASPTEGEATALVALPNLVDSSTVRSFYITLLDLSLTMRLEGGCVGASVYRAVTCSDRAGSQKTTVF